MTTPGRRLLGYRRSRFATQLPVDRRYTAAHYWLLEESPGAWRVGFTRFATRMLGDLVEYSFPLEAGADVVIGQEIGGVEGFKALTAIYSVMEGRYLGSNDALAEDITLVEHDPYRRGWLYRVEGRPDPDSVDVHAYAGILDATIDRLLESRHEDAAGGPEPDDEVDDER